ADARYQAAGSYAPAAGAGNAYVKHPTDGSVKAPFYMASAPTGWTRETAADLADTMIRLVTTGGGTATIASRQGVAFPTTEGHALTEGQLAAHSHAIKHDNVAVDAGAQNITVAKFSITGDLNGAVTRATTTAGSGVAHAHAIRLRYADFLVARFTG
ncbi:MAG TPA: hypothetical protein VLF66_19250, partial [Thermoanaerobaculia bacterium]|nr:hypothetical protein [Thermoanaerobaculia bacterium]